MSRFSVRPTLTLKGRTFKGLRGWSGKPFHPPLTDFPITAYVLGAVFDVISAGGRHHGWAREFFHAGPHAFIAREGVLVLTPVPRLLDWLPFNETVPPQPPPANTHPPH